MQTRKAIHFQTANEVTDVDHGYLSQIGNLDDSLCVHLWPVAVAIRCAVHTYACDLPASGKPQSATDSATGDGQNADRLPTRSEWSLRPSLDSLLSSGESCPERWLESAPKRPWVVFPYAMQVHFVLLA